LPITLIVLPLSLKRLPERRHDVPLQRKRRAVPTL
jgi:hypothetical protein